MKQLIIVFLPLFIFLAYGKSHAQGENNVWLFGDRYSLDFNHSTPLLRDNTYYGGQPYGIHGNYMRYNYAQAVCNANGEPLFFVQNYVFTSGAAAPSIFDKFEQPIAGTQFLPINDASQTRPIVVPHPGNSDQYYIFYIRNGGLIYCLFDLTLNNGLGDIVPGFKNVLHYSYNTIWGNNITSVQGCDGVWLIAKQKIQNHYLSFKIDVNGIASAPIISEVDIEPSGCYWGNNHFELVSSPDGKMLATSTPSGTTFNCGGSLELYDFEKCSGKVKNPRVIESGAWVYGVGFSPNSSKLYAAYSEFSPSLTPIASWLNDQNLYQFDLSTNDLTAIISSKTLVLTNPIVNADEPFCPIRTPPLGSMKIGPDGKMYMLNSSPAVCPNTGSFGMAFHVINEPDLPGISCNPYLNHIYNSENGMSSGLGRTNLPLDIVKAPSIAPDTISNSNLNLTVCFKEDTFLTAPLGVSCVEWSTGAADTSIVIGQSGTYWIRYLKDCTVFVDTFVVYFIGMPHVDHVQYGCPGYIQLKAGHHGGQPFGMALYNSNNGKIYENTNAAIHYVPNLNEDVYNLKISSNNSCDTTIAVELKAYPLPDLSIYPPSANIIYGEVVTLTAFGALNYIWQPLNYVDTPTNQTVVARPKENTKFSVIGINEYGCRDTAFVMIEVDYNKHIPMPNAFTPNGDGRNDIFSIPDGAWKVIKFEVYNRFGQPVYQHTNGSAGWDGNFNGKACDIGVYHYAIVLSMPDKTLSTLKGEIHLIR